MKGREWRYSSTQRTVRGLAALRPEGPVQNSPGMRKKRSALGDSVPALQALKPASPYGLLGGPAYSARDSESEPLAACAALL